MHWNYDCFDVGVVYVVRAKPSIENLAAEQHSYLLTADCNLSHVAAID